MIMTDLSENTIEVAAITASVNDVVSELDQSPDSSHIFAAHSHIEERVPHKEVKPTMMISTTTSPNLTFNINHVSAVSLATHNALSAENSKIGDGTNTSAYIYMIPSLT